MKLYAKYLLADHLSKIAEKAGVDVEIIQISEGSGYSADVHIQVRLTGSGHGPESNEEAAVRLLAVMPELALRRSNGLIYLDGTTYLGFRYQFYTGSGVCERVQVGERVVPAQPERVEPIFEVRCPDPLRDLEAVQS